MDVHFIFKLKGPINILGKNYIFLQNKCLTFILNYIPTINSSVEWIFFIINKVDVYWYLIIYYKINYNQVL